jgi:cytochrome b561
MLALLALHVGAALWHIIRGDGVGARMGIGKRP